MRKAGISHVHKLRILSPEFRRPRIPLLYRDAYRLTGLRGDTFTKFAESLGVRLR